MKTVILDGVTLNPGDNPWTPIEDLLPVTLYEKTEDEDIIQRSKDAEILLTNKTPLTKETLEQLPNLKYIGVLATGYDVVDIKAAAERDIPVTNTPGYANNAVPEHVFALIFECYRQVSLHSQQVKDGEWGKNGQFCFWSTSQRELGGKTIGIIGFGNTGNNVARIANGFGMNILAYAPRPKPMPSYDNFAYAPLKEVLEKSDIITLHCPLTEETKHIINEETLALMKPDAIIINTARGPLLDEPAVAKALNSGKLGGLAVDVVSEEPIAKDHPFLSTPNTFITPHLAWATVEARTALMQIAADNIQAFLDGTPQNVVNGVTGK
ncbi:D-2-hydroxyacid dehydrogenase [Halodesulfovibrio marinisediminis]|uniref:Glycerate dehydrogenase n=1 Tax=Halodesulfovibrio marinisediminis DSM 17456 TaxID=1121457 RepID=A0A1N6I3P7_9BACT|nr:D-2-hydroxyacid dehydrogenase [Halodesulfovibrio marinisediminis]SIO26656.1 glycerate dehydrogenase [Halodesulfovibrio marinisediminis DSM 17456]